MLASQHAAHLDTKPQDVGAERFGALQLALLVGVVHDQWMQIAIARMEHIGDPQAVLLATSRASAQDERQRAARDRAIHAVIVGRDAADGRERRFPARPEQLALVSLLLDAGVVIAPFAAQSLRRADQMVDLRPAAIELHDQQRLDVERIAGVDELLGGMDRGPVHHLHAAWDDARADDIGDAWPARSRWWESRAARRAPSTASSAAARSLP